MDEFYPEFLKVKNRVEIERVKNNTGISINLFDNPLNLKTISQIFQFNDEGLNFELKHFTLKNIRCMCGENIFRAYASSDCNTAFMVAIYAKEQYTEPSEIGMHKNDICLYIKLAQKKYDEYFRQYDTGRNLYRGIKTVSSDKNKKVTYQPLTLQTYAFNTVQYPIWKNTGVSCYLKIERIIWEHIFKDDQTPS